MSEGKGGRVRRAGGSILRPSQGTSGRGMGDYDAREHGQVSGADFKSELLPRLNGMVGEELLSVQSALEGRTLIADASMLPFAKLDFTGVDLSHCYIEPTKRPLVQGSPSKLPELWEKTGNMGWARGNDDT